MALTAAGIAFRLHHYAARDATRGRGGSPSYGQEAVDALGLEPRAVFKTLVASVDGKLTVAVVPVSGTLDLKALANAVGAKRATMAEPADAERATGYVVGGISPINGRSALPVVIDESVLALAEVYVSAGRRGLQVSLAPSDLISVTQAGTAPLLRTTHRPGETPAG